MKLREFTIEQLADMVIGDNPNFPYKSSSKITKFFRRCGFPFVHDGSTRKWWVAERLKELDLGPSQSPDLPSDDIVRIVVELFDIDDFDRDGKSTDVAVVELNKVLTRQGLEAYFDLSGRCNIRNNGSGVNSSNLQQAPRPLSPDEIVKRRQVAEFLETASEDVFTERLLVPLFRRLGFHRVSASGHTEKTLEYGKDLWMKYQLPTGHWIYFCAQVKRKKLDATGGSGDANTATALNQAQMAFDHPIFDPDSGRQVLLDHLFFISAGEITRAARNWLVGKLDQGQRRHIIFMDRDEFLDHSARILIDLQFDGPPVTDDSAIPF